MLNKLLRIAAPLLVAVGALMLVAPQRGKASDIDSVLVVNGPKKPVPVTLGGQPLAVTVAGPPGSSLPTRDVESVGRTGFVTSDTFAIPAGEYSDGVAYHVGLPADSEGVIDRVSVVGKMPVGQKLLGVQVAPLIRGDTGGDSAGIFMRGEFAGNSPAGFLGPTPGDLYSAVQEFNTAIDPTAPADANLSFSAYRDKNVGTATIIFTVYGHFVTPGLQP